ncbi:hypothetical protein ABMA28_007791 [Loxostege sticticalis]|uniref:BED-type domain-containing protein n=1 Tax=Loxostege sticticalis TaxID=481309 RepID=A0ABD0SL04_LOXSC
MSARKRSALWNHFETEGSDSKKAKCSYCAQVLALPNGNVGNLGRHMKSKHPTIPLVPERQALPPSSSATSPPNTTPSVPALEQINLEPLRPRYNNPQPTIRDFAIKPLPPRRAEKIDNQLMMMIAKEFHPLRLVEEEEFAKFVALLNPSYSLPTRKTISESILPKQYEKLLQITKNKLATDSAAVCLSTDGWTSINNESFVAVTAHYISHDAAEIKLETVLLGCIKYTERHTAENICELLKTFMNDWQIKNKVTAISSDNAANMIAAVRAGNWRHIACLAHSINRAVQTSLGHISSTHVKVKQVVEYFKRSSHAQTKLKEIQKQLNVPDLKLKQDVATRWNSTYDMLTRIVAIKDAVIATLALLRNDLSLSTDDWQIIEQAIPILKIFNDVTTEISAEKNVTLSKVSPLYKIMSNFVKGLLRSAPNTPRMPQIQSLLTTLDQQLDRRFAHLESNDMYAEATILDPRFKRRGFKHDRNYETALNVLKQRVGRISQDPETIPRSTTSQSQAEAPVHPAGNPSIWEEFDREVAGLRPENSIAAGIVEVDRYIQEPMLSRQGNPLTWWHQRKEVYPHLFRYMLKRLHLTATSVPCERIFSKAGYTLSERRSRLASKKLEQLLFIGANAHLLKCEK